MTPEKSSMTDKALRTRKHILDTALALFVANGYEATTMREIAAAVAIPLTAPPIRASLRAIRGPATRQGASALLHLPVAPAALRLPRCA